MRARARVYPPYHACFLFAFLLSFVSAVFARGSARPILMTVCIPHTHPHRHLSHMFFFLFCCCRAHHAHPAIVPRRRPSPHMPHTLPSTYAPPSLVPSSLPLPLSPSHLMSSTTPRPAAHAYQYVHHPLREYVCYDPPLTTWLWTFGGAARPSVSSSSYFFLLVVARSVA